MASKKQKSISFNLIVNGIKTLMSVLFPLITFPYASRILGASGIGKVNYASSIISYFSLISSSDNIIFSFSFPLRIFFSKSNNCLHFLPNSL